MAARPPPDRLNCPVCSKLCMLPGANADSFPNNLYALHIIEMDKDSVGHENTILKLKKKLSMISTIKSLSSRTRWRRARTIFITFKCLVYFVKVIDFYSTDCGVERAKDWPNRNATNRSTK